jgi:hypothetical protein
MTAKTDRFTLVTHVIRLEEEVATLRGAMLQLSSRMLRLELALSVLDKDGVVTAVLRPEQFQPEQF